MANLHVSSTPHIHQKGSSTRNIMLDVVIALIPATIAGVNEGLVGLSCSPQPS